jgi:hypothetical protein
VVSVTDYLSAKEATVAAQNVAMSMQHKVIKYKDELSVLQAERAAYLKAALKMFQRGIVELELQVFLAQHTNRSKNRKQFLCGTPPVAINCDFSSLMRHWRTCPMHASPPGVVNQLQVGARKFTATANSVEISLDNLYSSLSTPQHHKSGDYPIKLTPFSDDADTLALVSFLDFYKVEYCLLCDEEGVVGV